MKKDGKSSTHSLAAQLSILESYATRYAVLLFLLLLLAVYGFVAFKVMSYSNAEPGQSEVNAQVKAAATPRVSQSVVEQMLGLQDHSVNVKALFDQARSNPFQE